HNISYVEDPTRIFRGVRFEARFGFKMDQQTEKLALQSIDRVKELSAHRIVEEMIKLFAEGHSTEIIARLFELKFWQQFSVSKASCEPSLQHAKQLENLYTNHESLKNLDGEPSWFSLFLIPFYQEGIIEQA